MVLVDFWTYTCINWIRTLPYVRAWAAKYKDQGLVVVGVHSPEFDFEKDVLNVRPAAKALGVDFPIAVDSQHAIWNAYRNQYWPAIYLVDAKGRIRHRQFGEGNYEQVEKAIQELLDRSGPERCSPGQRCSDAEGSGGRRGLGNTALAWRTISAFSERRISPRRARRCSRRRASTRALPGYP